MHESSQKTQKKQPIDHCQYGVSKTLCWKHEQPFLREGLLLGEGREKVFQFQNKKRIIPEKTVHDARRIPLFLYAGLCIITKNEREKWYIYKKMGKMYKTGGKTYRKRQMK